MAKEVKAEQELDGLIKVEVMHELGGFIEVQVGGGEIIVTPEELPKLIDKMKGAAQKIQDLRKAGKLPHPKP